MMVMMMVVWWLLTNYMKKCPAHLQWTTVGSALGFIFCLNSRTNLWMITINPWLSLDAHWLSPNQCVRKLWNALVRPVGEMKLGKKTLTSFPIIHLLNPELPKKHIFHVFTLFWVWGKPKIALTIFEKLEKNLIVKLTSCFSSRTWTCALHQQTWMKWGDTLTFP